MSGQENRSQQFAGCEDILVVARHEIDNRDPPRFAAPRPERGNALERGRERNHRARRQRHADVSAHRRLVPDLERGQKRPATLAEQRGRRPVGRRSCRRTDRVPQPCTWRRSPGRPPKVGARATRATRDRSSVWTSTWGSEKSQVPPASHANPASQEAISSARAGRRTRLTVCRSIASSRKPSHRNIGHGFGQAIDRENRLWRFDYRPHVHRDDRAVLHDDTAVDYRKARLLRRTKQRGGDRIVQAPA